MIFANMPRMQSVRVMDNRPEVLNREARKRTTYGRLKIALR